MKFARCPRKWARTSASSKRFAVFELDKGDDFFVGVLVFHTDDGCGFDGVEFVNRLFDFARINVLPFGNNQVFFAIDDKDKAVFVYRDKIACFNQPLTMASSVASRIFR